METLGIRMERACDNALKLARFLENMPGITVNYPGLPSSQWHEAAERILDGRFGAILTLRVGSRDRAFAIMNELKIPQIVSNIGDTKTLIVHPESTISAHSTEQEKKDAAVYDDMIRVSVGIEDADDLIEDFDRAITKHKG
jgi:O-acetylhomoserine (thiol)-lyase